MRFVIATTCVGDLIVVSLYDTGLTRRHGCGVLMRVTQIFYRGFGLPIHGLCACLCVCMFGCAACACACKSGRACCRRFCFNTGRYIGSRNTTAMSFQCKKKCLLSRNRFPKHGTVLFSRAQRRRLPALKVPAAPGHSKLVRAQMRKDGGSPHSEFPLHPGTPSLYVLKGARTFFPFFSSFFFRIHQRPSPLVSNSAMRKHEASAVSVRRSAVVSGFSIMRSFANCRYCLDVPSPGGAMCRA